MTITTNTYDLLDGFDVCTQGEQRIRDEIVRTNNRNYDSLVTAEDFVNAAVSGSDFPDNPQRHNEKIRVQRQHDAARTELLKNALKSLQARKQAIIAEHSDEALKYLSIELTALMGEVREAQKALGNVRTAEDVLNADDPNATTAWKSQRELISRYTEIRSVQHTFTKPKLGPDEFFKLAAVGYVRNSLEQTEFWLSRRGDSLSHRAANDSLTGVRDFDAWLGNGGTARFKHTTSAIPAKDVNDSPASAWDYLVWLATEAEPWIPSPSQLAAAFDAANLTVAPTDYSKYRVQEQARDRYFEVIGMKPLVAYTNGSDQEKPENRKKKVPSFGEAAARYMS